MSHDEFCNLCGTRNSATASHCRQCGAPLVSATNRASQSVRPVPSSPASLTRPRSQESPRPWGSQPELPARRPLSDVVRETPGSARTLDTAAAGTAVEGVVVSVSKSEEPPDNDWARLLFGLLLTVDAVVVFGAIALYVLVVTLIIFIIAAILGFGGCVGIPLSLFFNMLITIFGPVMQRFGGMLGQRQVGTVPVLSVRIRNSRTRQEWDCRIKGPLRGSIDKGDRVRIWGTVRNGIVYFRRGENLNTGASLTRPLQPSIWLLAGLVVVNVAAAIYVLANPLVIRLFSAR